ncbi:nuclear transport factor 2 family protein [Flavisolibacter nicotianae]|uniref:nuclear transport factor 2 family protein n=1 Tax=Flavisolibacter nicotianae TaxID=2364882 RepID=UPI000EB02BF4|nr:nuclear transport factor 2 family protein [Flavisolibacter nicotianae]
MVNKDETQILSVIRQLAKGMIERDITGMNRILDKEYTLTHMTGYVQPKAEWFNEVIKESMKYYSASEVFHTVTVNGNKATATMQNLVDARIWGSRNTWRLQQVMRLEKRDGQWIILNSVASVF